MNLVALRFRRILGDISHREVVHVLGLVDDKGLLLDVSVISPAEVGASWGERY